MYIAKLCRLALSTLIAVTPVNFDYDIDYPFTRTDSVFARISYNVDDLGEPTPLGGTHNYNVNFNVTLFCNGACTIRGNTDASGGNISENIIELHFVQQRNGLTPNQLTDLLADVPSTASAVSSDNTYTSDESVGSVTIPVLMFTTTRIKVYFPATNNMMILNEIDYRLGEFSNLWFIKNYLQDKDVPASSIQTVKNYIDNGEYSNAINFIKNYYYESSVTENEQNETVVNNYNTKDTDLNTYFNIENNFADQIETDFTNQNQNIPLEDTTLNFSNLHFTKSAEWVTLRFNDLFDTSPYGKLLSFSLITGLILALIGRFKR